MAELKAIVTRADAWEACLALWKRLSEMPDLKVVKVSYFKYGILNELGYQDCVYGCPFCTYFGDRYNLCAGCPLYKKFDGCLKPVCPYSDWNNNAHDQAAAKKFYDCLCGLYEEEQANAGET